MGAVKPMKRAGGGRAPVEYHCDILDEMFYIKPLKLRQVLTLYGATGEARTPLENVESVLRLATAALVNQDGAPRFGTLEECEEVIGDADVFLEMQEQILAVQGMAEKPKKK